MFIASCKGTIIFGVESYDVFTMTGKTLNTIIIVILLSIHKSL